MSKIPVILYTSQRHVKTLSIKTVELALAARHPKPLQGQHPSQLVTAAGSHPAAGPVVVPGG